MKVRRIYIGITLLVIAIALIAPFCARAQGVAPIKRITDLPPAPGVSNDDLFIIEDDPSGTPKTKRLTFSLLKSGLGILSGDMTLGENLANTLSFYVRVSNAVNKPALRFNGSVSKWQFSNDGTEWSDFGSGGGGVPLDDLTDVTIASAASGNFVRFNGAAWVNAMITDGDVPDTIALTSITQIGARSHASLQNLSADDHPIYHTNARALTWLGTRSTTDLPEGANLYFTNGRVTALLTDANIPDTITVSNYQLSSEKNTASGYAGLTGSTKLAKAQGDEVWGLADLSDVASKRGNSSQVQMTTGSAATDDCAKFDANGNIVSAGAACGTGGATSVTAASTFGTDNRVLRADGTGRGAQSSGVTIDDSNNLSTPGSISLGVGGSEAGVIELGQGTAPSLGVNAISHFAPASVTSYGVKWPGASATGFLLGTDASNINTFSFVGFSGTGNVARATSPTFVTDITTPKVIGGTSSGGNVTLMTTTNATKGYVDINGFTAGIGAAANNELFLYSNNVPVFEMYQATAPMIRDDGQYTISDASGVGGAAVPAVGLAKAAAKRAKITDGGSNGGGLEVSGAGATNGQKALLDSESQLVVLSTSGPDTDTTIDIPARSFVISITALITTSIGGVDSTNLFLVGATTGATYGVTNTFTAGSTITGMANHADAASANATAQKVRISLQGGSDNIPSAGAVRITIHYIQITPPTS